MINNIKMQFLSQIILENNKNRKINLKGKKVILIYLNMKIFQKSIQTQTTYLKRNRNKEVFKLSQLKVTKMKLKF